LVYHRFPKYTLTNAFRIFREKQLVIRLFRHLMKECSSGPLTDLYGALIQPRHFPTIRTTESIAVKRTFQPSVLVRKRRHGFRARKATVGGRKVLVNRRSKGRKRLSA